MKNWEKEVAKLDLHRASVRYDIDVIILTCYSRVFLSKLQVTLLALEHNIGVYRKMKPRYLKEVSHLLLPVDNALF
jgi:hypothetical protein